MSQTINGATTYSVWDGWNLIITYDARNTWTNAYWHGVGGMLGERGTGNTGYYCYSDGSGSTSHIADMRTGQLLEWYRYDLQGTPVFYNSSNVQITGSSYGIRHLFTGQQWYSELGLYDLRNRFYSPDIGRFLQADPAGFNGDSTNLYRYCHNNPTGYKDTNGLQPVPVAPEAPQMDDPGFDEIDPDRGLNAGGNIKFIIDTILGGQTTSYWYPSGLELGLPAPWENSSGESISPGPGEYPQPAPSGPPAPSQDEDQSWNGFRGDVENNPDNMSTGWLVLVAKGVGTFGGTIPGAESPGSSLSSIANYFDVYGSNSGTQAGAPNTSGAGFGPGSHGAALVNAFNIEAGLEGLGGDTIFTGALGIKPLIL